MAGQGSCATGALACIPAEQALALVDGLLGPAERAAVERRIDACARCRAVVAAAARRTGAPAPAGAEAGAPPVSSGAPMPAPIDRARATAALGARPRPRGGARPAVIVDDPADLPPAAAGPTDRELRPGEVVGRYVVERALGAGGMGVVSLARDPELRRPVVIKLVHPNMGQGGSREAGDELEARLRREAQAMAQVSHSNVVQIFDIGRRGDRVFLAMEYVEGTTLEGWLRDLPRSAEEILAVLRQAGAGLAAAHRAGLVHRDFKPSNVLVGKDGVVKVTDFGLARAATAGTSGRDGGATRQLRAPQGVDLAALHAAAPASTSPRTSGVHAVLTEVAAVVGTPAYMAPEQAAGEPVDARTDQYALALTLLDALVRQSPVRRRVSPDGDRVEVAAALVASGVDADRAAAVIRALALEPSERFASVEHLLGALAAPAARPQPRARRRRWPWLLAGVAVTAAGGAAAWFALAPTQRRAPCEITAPLRFTEAVRARAAAPFLGASAPFAAWEAERLTAELDRVVGDLAAGQRARCEAPTAAGSAAAACLAKREAALDAAVAAFQAPSPPDDPWRFVRPIAECDAAPRAASTELRDRLRGADAAQARAVADEAGRRGEDLLAADAAEAAALAGQAAGAAPAVIATDLRAMYAAGERAGSDWVRARSLLRQLELGRWRGDYATAQQAAQPLRSIVGRHRDAPRDVAVLALAEGRAFTELGDTRAAFAAWQRAAEAAAVLGDRDAALAAAVGAAWARHALRFDLAGAREAARAALAVAGGSPGARSAALDVACDLALEARDGAGARAALAEAAALDGARATQLTTRLRAQRARALAGDVEGALAELDALGVGGADGPLAALRITVARGQVLLAADRPGEARAVLEPAVSKLWQVTGQIANAERLELDLLVCEAQLASSGDCKSGAAGMRAFSLHPDAPVRARILRLELRSASSSPGASGASASSRSYALSRLRALLIDAEVDPVQIAEVSWQLAQLGVHGSARDRAELANAARAAFAHAGRTDDVAAIDGWLAAHTGGAAPAGDPAGSDEGTARGPQP